jgi:hypothetical protein
MMQDTKNPVYLVAHGSLHLKLEKKYVGLRAIFKREFHGYMCLKLLNGRD